MPARDIALVVYSLQNALRHYRMERKNRAFETWRTMNSQLQTIIQEFNDATARLNRLVQSTPADAWLQRSDPTRWSIGECIEHLNLTGRAYLPILDAGIAGARRIGGDGPSRYRRDPIGWILWKTMGPPVRHRVQTASAFIPVTTNSPDELVAEFRRLQTAQIERVRECDGLPITNVRVASPFNAKVHYNLYSCLSILPPHQHRHLWQAEQLVTANR